MLSLPFNSLPLSVYASSLQQPKAGPGPSENFLPPFSLSSQRQPMISPLFILWLRHAPLKLAFLYLKSL